MNTIIKPEQVKMARAALGWGVKELSERADVGINTITRYEKRGDIKVSTLNKIVDTLSEHVQFIPENGGGAGVRLKK